MYVDVLSPLIYVVATQLSCFALYLSTFEVSISKLIELTYTILDQLANPHSPPFTSVWKGDNRREHLFYVCYISQNMKNNHNHYLVQSQLDVFLGYTPGQHVCEMLTPINPPFNTGIYMGIVLLLLLLLLLFFLLQNILTCTHKL